MAHKIRVGDLHNRVFQWPCGFEFRASTIHWKRVSEGDTNAEEQRTIISVIQETIPSKSPLKQAPDLADSQSPPFGILLRRTHLLKPPILGKISVSVWNYTK